MQQLQTDAIEVEEKFNWADDVEEYDKNREEMKSNSRNDDELDEKLSDETTAVEIDEKSATDEQNSKTADTFDEMRVDEKLQLEANIEPMVGEATIATFDEKLDEIEEENIETDVQQKETYAEKVKMQTNNEENKPTGTIRKKLPMEFDVRNIEIKSILKQMKTAKKQDIRRVRIALDDENSENIGVKDDKQPLEEKTYVDDELTCVKNRLQMLEEMSEKNTSWKNQNDDRSKTVEPESKNENAQLVIKLQKEIDRMKAEEMYRMEFRKSTYKNESDEDVCRQIERIEAHMKLLTKKKEMLNLENEVEQMQKKSSVVKSYKTKEIEKTEVAGGKFDPSKLKCYNCSQWGHMKVDCPYEERPENACFRCWGFGHSYKTCARPRYIQRLKIHVKKDEEKKRRDEKST